MVVVLLAVTPMTDTVHRQAHPMAGQAQAVAAAQALKLRVNMPKHVLIPDNPRVGIWDQVGRASAVSVDS